MRYKVTVEPEAVGDIFEIFDYIVNILHESVVAERIYRNIKEGISTLADIPKRHNDIDQEPYASGGVRKLSIRNYNAYYVVDDKAAEVHVIRVLYNRRSWLDIL